MLKEEKRFSSFCYFRQLSGSLGGTVPLRGTRAYRTRRTGVAGRRGRRPLRFAPPRCAHSSCGRRLAHAPSPAKGRLYFNPSAKRTQ